MSAGRVLRAFLALLPAAHLVFLLAVGSAALLYSRVRPPLTALEVHRALSARYIPRPVRWVPMEKLPAYVPQMFVRVEDSTFYSHHGIDLKALQDARRINRQLGYIYYGGSTITQQLARTLFLGPNRTYLRKYLEALASLEMELILSKERILELYLNSIEFGRGVYGIGAAARHHYGREAEKLRRDEYRRLAALAASPLRYTVKDLNRRRALAERYSYLMRAFP